MLEERDYMRRPPEENRNARSGMTCLYTLIAVNVITFLLFRRDPNFLLFPPAVEQGKFMQIVTAVFMHEDFFHILFNMYALYFFGSITASILGAKRFLALFLTAGIAGNLLWLAANWGSNTALLGASGAVMGVIMTTAMLVPDFEILILFIPFPLKLRTAALVFAGIDVLCFALGGGHVAYLAHIGGFLAGYVFSAIFLRKEIRWDPVLSLFGKKPSGRAMPHGWRMTEQEPPQPKTTGRGPTVNPVTQRELDNLLDKISRQGINSLSEAEMERLRQARRQMRGE